MEGTLVHRGAPCPEAVRFMNRLRFRDIPFRVVTNAVGRSAEELAGMLQSWGMPVLPGEVLTPVHILDRYLSIRRTASYLFVGPERIRSRLSIQPQLPCSGTPEYVVLCDFEGIPFGYAELNRIFEMLHKGAKLLTLSSSPFYWSDRGPKLDTGAFCRLFESASGQEAMVLGKPSPLMYEAVLGELGLRAQEVTAIGDDVLTDIAGAAEAGIRNCLVRSGKYQPGDEDRIRPDRTVNTVLEALED